MRNLRNIHESRLYCPPELALTAAAFDTASDSIICAFGPTRTSTLLELKRWKKPERTFQPIASWEAPCPLPDLDCDEIVDLQFFPDSSTACLILAGGDLIVVREEPQPGEEKIEIVGSVDAGISAAAWSPDEELLVLTTNAATLLYMTRDFDNVLDITLHTDDLKVSNHVSVGWGKKETQFKGKKARALRDPTVPETVDEGVLSEHDLKETTISWRGDGAYLAVNSIESDFRRVIRVYSRDGVLDSVSEPVDGLVGALSWRPAGNLLAGVQYRDDLVRVIFFERNGLRHGQLDLRLGKEEVQTWGSRISLKWNIDSSVLAVCFDERIQLWTMNNYHYYLKQEISTLSQASSGKPVSLRWHSEKPLQFIQNTIDGVQRLVYSSVICGDSSTTPGDYGVVAVIDGKCLKMTPMRLANVPPPMALYEICLENNAIDVAISVDYENTRSVWISVLHHGGCSLYEWQLPSMMHEPPSCKWTVNPDNSNPCPGSIFLQVAFVNGPSYENSVVLLSHNTGACVLSIIDQGGLPRGDLSSNYKAIEGIVTSWSRSNSTVYIVTDEDESAQDDELVENIRIFNEHNNMKLSYLPTATHTRAAISHAMVPQITTDANHHCEDIILCLAENGSLFVNQRLLVRNCTSFLVTAAHLIYTTSQHLLKFVHLGESPEDLEPPPDTPENDERCRSIERGAKLVTVMPSISALVMQMPRGNLETIYPRALVLPGIRDSIDKEKYKKAFLACRNHRVDMNILHDHAPQQFISNVGLFLNQVQKVEYIDLFLSQLREEDVSVTMYRDTNRMRKPGEYKTFGVDELSSSKVNRVCDAFLDALENRTSTHFQNVVTAHVCKVPPNLDGGLGQIAGLRKKNPELVDAAIEHICFLADVNRLFDNALGLYDLELTLLIAQQSQKDPREYLPFLQNLQDEPQLRRQYSIDNHLGRHQKALKHLCEINAFEEVKAYTIKHSLYADAMGYYRYQEGKLNDLMRLYADYLHQQKNYKEAGIAYEYLLDYPLASISYHLAHLWRESLTCASLIPLPPPSLHSLSSNLATTLTEIKDFRSAATITLDYLHDLPLATSLFCRGSYFSDALRIASLHQRPDLLPSTIDPALVDAMASTTEFLADCKAQLHAQIPRLRELRTKKAEDPLAFFEGSTTAADDVNIPDNISLATDASTTGGGGSTLFTRYTNRTTNTLATNTTRKSSKNRRKEERKRARGKKGSIYEEEYLVNSIGRLVERINGMEGEVGRLVEGLMRRGMRERAVAVQAAMGDVVEVIRGCVGEVFGENTRIDGELGGERQEVVEEKRPKGGEGVVWDALQGGEQKREIPVIKELARLSLLGP